MARPKPGGALNDEASAGDETVTVSNVSFRQVDTREQPIPKQIPVPASPMAQRQTVRKDISDLLERIDHHFQYAFLNVLEQDLHRNKQRDGSNWRILLEAYLVVNVPDDLDTVANRFYALNHTDAYQILSSLGHDSRVYI